MKETARRGAESPSLMWTKLIRSFDIYDRPTARRIRSLNDSIFDEGGGSAAGVRRTLTGRTTRGSISPRRRRRRPIARFPAISIFPPSFEISLNFLPPWIRGGLSGNANGAMAYYPPNCSATAEGCGTRNRYLLQPRNFFMSIFPPPAPFYAPRQTRKRTAVSAHRPAVNLFLPGTAEDSSAEKTSVHREHRR